MSFTQDGFSVTGNAVVPEPDKSGEAPNGEESNVAKFTALTGAGTSAVSGLPADGQANLLVMAAVILGTAILLKAGTTIALFVITGRRKESITLLLGHPYVKSCRRLAGLAGPMPSRIP